MAQLGHVDLVVTACPEGLLAGVGQRRDSDNKKQRRTHLRFQMAIVNIGGATCAVMGGSLSSMAAVIGAGV